jgi:hypothetical protein
VRTVRRIGKIAAWLNCAIGVAYLIALALGLASLKSQDEPIGDPYFTVLEALILLMMPPMLTALMALHLESPPEKRIFSLAALCFALATAVITSVVHFTVWTVSRPIAAAGFTAAPLFFSFEWPSVIYALDILAWDWFYALAMLSLAPIFSQGALEKTLRMLLFATGALSLAGLIGVPLADMQIRLIGVVGYAVVSPGAFFVLGLWFGRTGSASQALAASRK